MDMCEETSGYRMFTEHVGASLGVCYICFGLDEWGNVFLRFVHAFRRCCANAKFCFGNIVCVLLYDWRVFVFLAQFSVYSLRLHLMVILI